MTTVHNSHWPSREPPSDALRQSSPPEAPAPPSASFPAGGTDPTEDPAVEYGDDDIDDALSDHNEPNGNNSCGNRAMRASLQLQDNKEQKTHLERMREKRIVDTMAVKIPLYDGPPVADSNYNHLDPKHMFAVLEQIQRDIQQSPPLPATPAAPTTPQHDSFGYAIPCRRSSSTRNAEPVATSAQEHPYAVVDVTQKRLSHRKNKATRDEGNKPSVSAHSSQSDEPAVEAIARASDGRIEPYATVDITAMKDARQKQKALQDHETTHENTKQPHARVGEHDNTRETSSVHKPVDPIYDEVAKTEVITTTYLLTTEDDTIEPYAMVEIPYKYKTSKKHKVTCDTIKTSNPINTALSKLETDKNGMCTTKLISRAH